MRMTDRRGFLTFASAAAAATLPEFSFAAAWPKEKIIRAIVPFAAGSTIDIIGRIVLDPLSNALGQTIGRRSAFCSRPGSKRLTFLSAADRRRSPRS